MTTCDLFKAGLGPQIDIAAPTVDVSSIANGAYLRGTVTLSGSASDDVGLASVNVIVTINSTQAASIAGTISSGAWQAALDTKALSGGVEVQADLDIRATDNSGKVSEKKIVVYFDNVMPAITGMSPSTANLANSDFALSEKTTITGSVKDGLGLAKTVLTVGDISLTDTAHPASWSVVLDTSQFYDAGGNALHGATKLSSGLYQVGYSLISTDYAGNTSEPLTGLLYVNPDGSPVVNVGALTAGVNTSITYPRASSIVTGSNIVTPSSTFKFRVTDLDGIDRSKLYLVLARGTEVTSALTVAPTALASSSTVYRYKLGDYLDGIFTLTLKEAVLDSASLSGGGTVPTRAEYSITLPSAVGEYLLFIYAADYAANKVSGTSAERMIPSLPSAGAYSYSSLYITNSTTTITIDSPSEGKYCPGRVTVSGDAVSDDGLEKVIIKIVNTDTSTPVSAKDVALSGITSPWSYEETGLASGHYSVTVVARNLIGKDSGALSRSFIVDTANPIATINALSGSQSGNTAISGDSSDTGSGVKLIEYQLDSTSGTWKPAGGTSPWSGSLNLSSETEGPHTLYARATDVAGNVTDSGSYASTAFDVDRANPQATETLHSTALIQSATAVSFAGKADDFALTAGREASSAELSYSKDGGTAATITRTASGTTDGFTWDSATGGWSWTLPAPADHTGDGLHVITLVVTDRAGKAASVTRSAQIDTTIPSLTVSTPLSGYWTASSAFPISGTTRDTGGVGFSGNTTHNDVEYSLNGGAWIPLTLSGMNWGTSITLGAAAEEGPQTLEFHSTDKVGNQASSGIINFFYDKTPPTMHESGVGGGTNPTSYSTSTMSAIHFGGTVSDTDALASAGFLQVSINGAASVDVSSLASSIYTSSVTGSGLARSWALNAAVGSGGLADGVYTFVFTAKDIAGKTTSVTRTITVDTTKPASSITTPTVLAPTDSSYWLSGSTANFLGNSSDPGSEATGVAGVYYAIAAKTASAPAFSKSTWSLAGGTSNWNATVPLASEGEFTFYVAAVDAVGNIEDMISRDFGVDQSIPTVSESHASTFAEKASFTLLGSIADSNYLKALAIEETKGGVKKTVTLSTPTTVGGTGQTWTSESLPKNATAADFASHGADGSYEYKIVVTDVANKTSTIFRTVTIDTTPPTVTLDTPASWVSSSAYSISGTAADTGAGASGVASVTYKLDAGAWTGASYDSGTGKWTAILTGLAEGPHTLQVMASDAAANATETPASGNFGVDFNPPTLTVTTPAAPTAPIIASSASAFTGFMGAIGDTNAMAAAHSFKVSYTKNGGTAVEEDVPYTYAAHSTSNAWSWTPFTAGIDATSHAEDGIYVFTFTATDIAGKPTTIVRNLTIDTMAPQITMTSPVNPMAWYKDSPLKVTGVADDGAGSGVKNVYVRWDIAAANHSGDDRASVAADWTKANNTVSWNADLALSTEGPMKLWIMAVDNYGNWTTPTEASLIAVNFGFDQTKPTLDYTDTTPAATNAAYTFTGNVDDEESGLKSLTVSVDGAPAVSTGITYPVVKTYSYSVSLAGLAYGSHSYVFTAVDNAGNSLQVSRSVFYDNKSPTASFNNIDKDKCAVDTAITLVDASPKVTGSISDDTGILTVSSTVMRSADGGATWTPVSGLPAPATTAVSSKSWTFSQDLSALANDGLYRITITAGDTIAVPNSGPSDTVWFRVDRNNPTITALSSTAPSVYINADYKLTGTVFSENLSSVQYKLDEAASFTDLATSQMTVHTTSYLLDIGLLGASLSEGKHTIIVQATSTGQRVGSQSYTFYVDRTAPSLAVSQPASGAYLSGSSAIVSGSATDSVSNVKSVEYQFALGLSASVSGSAFSNDVTHSFAVGDIVFFAAYPGGSLPSLVSAATPYYVIASGLSSTSFQVSDSSSGTTAFNPGTGGSNFFVTKVGASSWSQATYGANAWSNLSVDISAMSQGNYLFLARATDNAGNVGSILPARACIDALPPDLAFTGMPASGILHEAFALSGTASDAKDASRPSSTNGIGSVELSLGDSAFPPAHAAAIPTDLKSTTDWAYDLATAPASFFNGLAGAPASYAAMDDGLYVIYARAIDKAGRVTVKSYSFTKDGSAPTIAFNNLSTIVANPTVFQDASPKITGTFSDTSGMDTMSGTIENYDYGAAKWIVVSNKSFESTDKAKSFAFSIDMSSAAGGLDLANGRYRLTFVAYDIAVTANKLTTPAIEFMIAKASPSLTISAPLMGTFQRGAVTVTGTASDANAISSIQLWCTDGTKASATASVAALTPTWTGGVASYTWTASVPITTGAPVTQIPDGALTIYARATAGSARQAEASRDFTLDTASPAVSISSPLSGTKSVGNLNIIGTSTDPGSVPSGVTGTIQYQIGKNYNLASGWTSANVSGGSYSWTISLGDMSTYATDAFASLCDASGNAVTLADAAISGNTFTVTSRTYVDGSTVYLSGSPLPQFGGSTVSANTPYFVTNISGNSFQLSSTWPTKTIQTVTNAGSSVKVSTEPPMWKLPIVFQAVDKAGNVNQKTDYYIILDPSGNVPVVSITQPGTGLTFGGQQRITGTAIQPVWIHDIEVNVDPTNTGTFSEANWAPATLVTTGNSVIWYYDINTANTYPQSGVSQTVQVQVRAWNSTTAGGGRGSIHGLLTNPLVMTFNNSFPQLQNSSVNGASYYTQMMTKGTASFAGTVSTSKGLSKLEVVESSPLTGSYVIYDASTSYGYTTASNGLNWSSTVTPPATKTSGTYPGGNTIKVMITSTGSSASAWTDIGAPSADVGTVFNPGPGSLDVGSTGGSFIESDASGNFKYAVAIAINSSQMYNGTSGEYAFNLRMTDKTSPTSQVANYTVDLGIDNYHPTSSQINPVVVTAGSFITGTRYEIMSVGSTDFKAIGSPSNSVGQTFVAAGAGEGSGTAIPVMAGSIFKIQGAATDVGTGYGTIASLKKVVVYLTDPSESSLLYLKGASSTTSATYFTHQTAKNMSNSGAIEPVPYPVTASGYTRYFASIDSTSEIGLADANDDGFVESFITDGNAMNWWAQIDTTLLADGPALIHYVVWDAAGNATHYSQPTFVSNKAPMLSSIDIGTDINGDGSVSEGEIKNYAAGYAAPAFTVLNDRLYLKANYSGGTNAPIYFSVKYNGIERNGTLTNGSVTISNFTINPIPDSSGANDRTFYLYVYDSTPGTVIGTNSQGFLQAVSLTIKNNDIVPPTIDLAPFGKRWSAPKDVANGGINTDAGKTLGNVSAYTDNVAGSIGNLLGHVEYARDSAYNPIEVTLSSPATGSFVTAFDNKLKVNSVVYFAWTTAPTSAPNGRGPYYVIGSPTSSAFQVAATRGSASPAVFSSDADGICLATPDLSGTVLFRGKFADDQRVNGFSVTIPGYNSGNPVALAAWDASLNSGKGGLAPNTSGDWTFAVDADTESVSLADGHVANWAFSFDTSKIATVAASNVPITFTATDGGGNASTTSMNVDIAPYIASFSLNPLFGSRLTANSVMNNSGAEGYYPVYQGATGHVIKGFNLSTGATVGSAASGYGPVSLLNPVLDGTTTLTVDIPSSLLPPVGSSSNLTVTTNGIPSINNGTNYVSIASTNANGVAFSSYLIEEESFTNARKIYVDDRSPTISIAPFGQSYPVQDTDDAVAPGNKVKELSTPPAENPNSSSVSKTVLDNYTKNVPYAGDDSTLRQNWQGHVEWAADNVKTVNRPALSGQVTFKGKAFDNQRINRITATIVGFDGGSGSSNPFEIYNSTNGFEYYDGSGYVSTPTAGYTGSGAKNVLLGTNGWTAWPDGDDYKVTTSARAYKGHVLNWNFTWDTSRVSGVTASGTQVTFTVYDANDSPHQGQDTMTVDIVPYITKVDTKLSAFYMSAPSVFNRTALGHYPVAENDTIALYGFNLNGASTSVTVNGTAVATAAQPAVLATAMIPGYPYAIASVGTTTFTNYGASANTVGTVFTATSAGTGTGTVIPDANHSVRVSIGSAAASGPLVATVGSATSTNNLASRATKSRTWNHLPNNLNNNLLIDDINIDIWRYTQVAKSASGGINNPKMKIGPYISAANNNRIGFSFGQSTMFFSMPGLRTTTAYTTNSTSTPATDGVAYSHTPFLMNYGWFTENDFAYDPRGNTYGAVLCPDTTTPVYNSANFNLLTRQANNKVSSMNVDDNYTAAGFFNNRLVNTSMNVNGANNTDIFRVQSPAIVATLPSPGSDPDNGSNKTNLYIAYYDELTGEIRFRYGTVGATADAISSPLKDLGYFYSATFTKTFVSQYNTHLYQSEGNAIPRDIFNGAAGATIRPYQNVASTATGAQFATTTTYQSGQYVALGVIQNYGNTSGNDVVVIAWYDAALRQLVYSYNTAPKYSVDVSAAAGSSITSGRSYIVTSPGTFNWAGVGGSATLGAAFTATGTAVLNNNGAAMEITDSSSQWQSHAKVIDSTTTAGQNVKLAVDSGGGIHIVYYSASGGDLKYAYLSEYGDPSPDVATIDSYLSVGTQCSIDVAQVGGNQVPYVSYFMPANSGTIASAKIAYRVDFTDNASMDGAESDKYTQKWETTIVPTNSTPTDSQVSIGVAKDGSGALTSFPTVTPSASGDTTAQGFPVSQGQVIAAMTNSNPVVSFAVKENGVLEMWQKK